jgi:mycothiol synthase
VSGPFEVCGNDVLEPHTVRDLTRLIERVTDHDGQRPVSEHVWLHLKEGGDDGGRHLVARDSTGVIVGYAHLDVTDEVAGPSAEIAVDPESRRLGLGRMMLEQLVAASPDGRLRLWAHGEQAGAAELARGMGFARSRVLWQMRRSLYAPLPRPALPAGIDIRAFRPGVDDAAWLALNARAFAALPDQGGWDEADLSRRLREPWFSAEGFLVAWAEETMVGFHWTKVHGLGGHHHQPIGEVYVVGVDPERRGHGLGRALTLAGLHHLRSLDLSQAMLYVDAANTTAITLYESLGFARWDTDILFHRVLD